VITLLVFSSGLTGFLILDARKEGEKLGLLDCIYATCKLFLFHGEAESLSWHHEPHYAVIFISIAAFLGPLLSAAVLVLLVGQIAARILDQQGVRVSGHAVILGSGREGIHWANYLDEKRRLQFRIVNRNGEGPHPSWARSIINGLLNRANYLHAKRQFPIVVVNRNGEGPQLGRAREISKALLIGDMTDKRTRDRAAVLKSKMVVVCSGDELANIDTARAIEEDLRAPNNTHKRFLLFRVISWIGSLSQQPAWATGSNGPLIFCRVVSQSLLFFMKESANKERTPSRIRYFNIYDFVARDKVQEIQKPASDESPRIKAGPVHLIICGFGRFGQAVLHAAGKDETLFSRLAAVDIVDLHAESLLEEYRFSAPDTDDRILDEARTKARQFGILNRKLWDEVLDTPTGAQRLVFICTDNDVTNLEHALAIKRRKGKQNQDIRTIVVMRQLVGPAHREKGLSYATMDHSTDEQIRLLIADFNGRWEGRVKDPNGEEMLVAFTFKDGAELAGTVESREDVLRITNGKAMVDEISFKVKIGDETITHHGRLVRDTLTIKTHGPWGDMELKHAGRES
jgi:voltage-gated potassium channel Kch